MTSSSVGSWFTDVTAQPSLFCGLAGRCFCADPFGAAPVVIQWTAELVS
jgi:hypothetical protein